MTSTKPLGIVVLVSGTGTLLQSIMDNQNESYQVRRVVADMQCPALDRAAAAGVETRVVPLGDDRGQWNVAITEAVDEAQPDLIVSAGFMKILGKTFLEKFGGRTINTHPALLPAFPGAHAVRDALSYGVKVTGSTVHFIDAGVDTGEIIAQRPVTVSPEDTEDTLHERIKQVERQLIVEVLHHAAVDQETRKAYFGHD